MSSKTKQLARNLGLLRSKRKRPDAENTKNQTSLNKRRKGQLLSYVIVIDFESTCWENKKGAEEIIEFPAVLLDLYSGEVVSEFQQYVLPLENPKLSDFCKQLTGITQDQVDNGVPLPTCLRLFSQWVGSVSKQHSLVVMEPGHEYSECQVLCALATWSDWDLGVCLNYECQRKQIRRLLSMNQWMDIRALYKEFYDRRPSGLAGALEDLGIKFTGREHCGLDDARNTATLCYRMAKDGCLLRITKCISKAQATVVKPPDVDICLQDATSSFRKNDPLELKATCSPSPMTAHSATTSVCTNEDPWESNEFSEELVKELDLDMWEAEKCIEHPLNSVPATTSKCVSHVAPVTVLHQGKCTGKDPPAKGHHKQSKSKEQPSCIVPSDTIMPQQAPLQTSKTAFSPSTASASAGQHQSSGSFRTPSTVEWMKAKRTPSNTSPTLSSVFRGGKITPPLCSCGKRAKRKTTANSGPNDGRHFYVCPSGKGSSSTQGCGFFSWEHSHSSSYADAELSSDYSC